MIVILKLIKNIQIVVTVIKWSAVMMINLLSQFKRIEVKMLFFMEKMLDKIWYCKSMIKKRFSKPLKMTDEDEENFKPADECHICNKKYIKTDVRVRDHCHTTGNFRRSSHQDCNLNLPATTLLRT